MRHLYRIYWLFWVGLPILTAYPVPSSFFSDLYREHSRGQWEDYWVKYMLGLLSISIAAFTLAGCLCCRRHARPKGFEDKAVKCKQEFKNGSNTGQESGFEQSTECLGLDTARMVASTDRVQFEPLPVDRFITGPKLSPKPNPLPLSPVSFTEDSNQDYVILREPCREWFDAEELYVPRDKLKYLREIGRGWFGKVVEGRADLEESKGIPKNGGVVVRILTEEATTTEKAWFLGEATPYLKLRHQNVLALLGFCLETDPYLLLFESCPVGDLKGFLISNRDHKSKEALTKENIPTRMALEIAAGLRHMHNHGFVHTDLSARNCLVASDLSAKLGDYGTGVEKYPEDYYVVGDRALPIRWSAPESLECTDTTIETREITSQANIWSYAVLLWEVVNWGNRPYNSMCDEEVIQMLLSLKTDSLSNDLKIFQNCLENCPLNILKVMRLCLNLNIKTRPTLDEIRLILFNDYLDQEDFEQRWENFQPNTLESHVRSASLQDLRGSIDSDYWASVVDEKPIETLPSSFRLGPEETFQNTMSVQSTISMNTAIQESGSETEEESWKGRIERGVYTEKVKQKSKSVADLMVLVHIDPESDGEWSMGTQVSEKSTKKRLSVTGSDSDLKHATLADEFDEALRKLRDPVQVDTNKIQCVNNVEQPKLLTLTMDQEQTPILRLSLDSKENSLKDKLFSIPNTTVDNTRNEEHVLRLVSKGEPNLPLLRYVPDSKTVREPSEGKQELRSNIFMNTENNDACTFNEISTDTVNDNINEKTDPNNLVDILLWNHALDSALEKKVPGFPDENEFIESSIKKENVIVADLHMYNNSIEKNGSHFQKENSACDVNNDLSTSKYIEVDNKMLTYEDEEDRKHLSTPDDEQSSDSGFKDKESCEEEENIYPSCHQINSLSVSTMPTSTPTSMSIEEEPLRILFELDTILDAEYYGVLPESEKTKSSSLNEIEKSTLNLKENNPDTMHINNAVQAENNKIHNSETTLMDSKLDLSNEEELRTQNLTENISTDKDVESNYNSENNINKTYCNAKSEHDINCIPQDLKQNKILTYADAKTINAPKDTENYLQEHENDNEEEDSSTMSLQSDNSYVSFGIEEEFVTAIRNELREKLPKAQMPIIEPAEPHDNEHLSISNDIESKHWDDESDESLDQGSGGVDISIRYNMYGTPLSPILEERESTVTSESLMSNSRDASIASKESVPSEDVLLVDTRTNEMVLLEGLRERLLQDDDRDTTNGDISEEENIEYNSSLERPSEDKPHPIITGGAPLPSPEEETKWQQLPSFPLPLPLPLPLQDDLMSTSFATEKCWDSQDEEEGEEEDDEEEEEEEEEDEEEEDENSSSSSGEFVWKRYDAQHIEPVQIRNSFNDEERSLAVSEEDIGAEDEEEEEFTPSAWNATLAPHRSALRSPDKTLKTGDQKKSVWFKKQRYHCVYEYPKEIPASDSQGETSTTWEPTSYTDWEELMDEPRLDIHPLDYDDLNHTGNEEFYVSSSNRPFQFPASDSKYVSQFFPGASSTSINEEDQDEANSSNKEEQQSDNVNEHEHSQHQLGELRHTRDRLKLNLLSINSATSVLTKQPHEDKGDYLNMEEIYISNTPEETKTMQHQFNLQNSVDDNTLPEVPQIDTQCELNLDLSSIQFSQYDSEEKADSAKKCTVNP